MRGVGAFFLRTDGLRVEGVQRVGVEVARARAFDQPLELLHLRARRFQLAGDGISRAHELLVAREPALDVLVRRELRVELDRALRAVLEEVGHLDRRLAALEEMEVALEQLAFLTDTVGAVARALARLQTDHQPARLLELAVGAREERLACFLATLCIDGGAEGEADTPREGGELGRRAVPGRVHGEGLRDRLRVGIRAFDPAGLHPSRRLPGLAEGEARRMRLRTRRWHEQREHVVLAVEQHQVRTPAEELGEQRTSSARRCLAQLEDRRAVAGDLLELDHARAGEVGRQTLEERVGGTVMTVHTAVLQVQTGRVRVGGEPQPNHIAVRNALGVGREHDEQVARWQGLDVEHPRVLDQRRELATELAHMARAEGPHPVGAQLSSSSTL
jgi:hypothetical protein